VELLLSLGILDLCSLSVGFNTPASMTCEGDFSPARRYIIEMLLRNGTRVDGDIRAAGDSFINMLCKPIRLRGTLSILGKAVHPDDKELVKRFISLGVGHEYNREFEEIIAGTSAESTSISYTTAPHDGLSVVPSTIHTLSNLLYIDLSNNCITVLPDAFFKLRLLTRIDLRRNLLYEVSTRFALLSNLEELDVAENLIESLPTSLIKLKKLKTLICYDNPIAQPPKEIFQNAPGSKRCDLNKVMGYFDAVLSSGTVENLNLKVMVLGRSEAGKTSLINAMVERVSRLTRTGDRTVGIEQRAWTFPLSDNKNLIMKILDFAGQDEYYLTHHMYLTSRALYIVAFDLYAYKEEDFENVILFFIRSLETRVGNNARVLLVGTHADLLNSTTEIKQKCQRVADQLRNWNTIESTTLQERAEVLQKKIEGFEEDAGTPKATLDRLRFESSRLLACLRKRIHIPDRVYPVSSANCLYGIEDFRNAIERAALDKNFFPQIGEKIPILFDDIREWVRACRDTIKFCSYSQFVEHLHQDLKVEEANVIESAVLFLHDLGELLFFAEHRVVVLSLSWLIDAMKCIIRHDHFEALQYNDCNVKSPQSMTISEFESAKQNFLNKGLLSEALLRVFLWGPLNLNSTDFNRLLQVVEKFEIVIRLQDRNCDQVFLVPCFLPRKLKTFHKWPRKCPSDQIQMSYLVSCKRFMQTLPAGFFQRLEVHLFPLVSSCSASCQFAQESAMIMSWNLEDDKAPVSVIFKLLARHLDPTGGASSSESDNTMTCLEITIRSSNTVGSPAQSRRQIRQALEVIRQTVQGQVVTQWPGLMVDEFLVLREDYGDFKLLSLQDVDVRTPLLAEATTWVDSCGLSYACLKLADLELPLASSKQEVFFRLKGRADSIGSVTLPSTFVLPQRTIS